MMKNLLIILMAFSAYLHGSAQNNWGYFNSIDELRQYVLENGDSSLIGLQLWSFSSFKEIENELDVSKIKTLKVFSSKMADLQFLKGFKNLETLELDVKLREFNSENLPESLEQLKISQVPKKTSNGKSSLKLKRLELGGGWKCEDVVFLANGHSLDKLTLSSVDLVDIKCFPSPIKIRILQLEDCEINDLDNLKAFIAVDELKTLSISRTDFSNSVGFSSSFSKLERLTVKHCKLSSIEGLENLRNLLYMDFTNNRLDALEVNLPRLKYLNVSNNNLKTLILEQVDTAFALDVSYNKLKEIKGFKPQEDRLRAFYYYGNQSIKMVGAPYFTNIVSFSFAPQVVKLKMDTSKLEVVYDCSESSVSIENTIRVDWNKVKKPGIRYFKARDIEEFRIVPDITPPNYL